jgi:hypothetical protein
MAPNRLLGLPETRGRGRDFAAPARAEAGEPPRDIELSYAVDHSTISRVRARHAAETI